MTRKREAGSGQHLLLSTANCPLSYALTTFFKNAWYGTLSCNLIYNRSYGDITVPAWDKNACASRFWAGFRGLQPGRQRAILADANEDDEPKKRMSESSLRLLSDILDVEQVGDEGLPL